MALSKEKRDFLRKGLLKGSIQDIATLAKVSRISVSSYFSMKTKESETIEKACLAIYKRDFNRRKEYNDSLKAIING